MRVVACRARHGILCHSEGDRPIGRSLQSYGEWAEEELYLLSFFIRPGAVVLDLGANVGTHALAFSRFVRPHGRVIAIDAQDAVFDLLVFNMLINGATHVRCIRALAGRETTMRYFPMPQSSSRSAVVAFVKAEQVPGGKETGQLLPMPSLTVDSLALEQCDLMKIDVEGMELDVLVGASNTIEHLRPTLYFEQAHSGNFSAIFKLLRDANYILFWHAAHPFNRKNFRNNGENIFGDAREINVLALPAENRLSWQDQTAGLHMITEPNYAPPACSGSDWGWMLPGSAYVHLPPPTSSSLLSSLTAIANEQSAQEKSNSQVGPVPAEAAQADSQNAAPDR